MVKADVRQPLWYAAVLALLLGYRLWVNYLPKLKIDLRATNTG